MVIELGIEITFTEYEVQSNHFLVSNLPTARLVQNGKTNQTLRKVFF